MTDLGAYIEKVLVSQGKDQAWLANQMGKMPVCEVRRKHVKALLTQIGQNKGKWTAPNYNKYRSYVMSLFKILMIVEAVELNPVTGIEKMKGLRKIRSVLSDAERKTVVDHLSENYPSFYRWVQIFFHSGGRETEIMKVRVEDVDLINQTYKVTVKKGVEFREWNKVIKDIALPYWKDAVKDGKPSDYVFSRDLKPGAKPIRPEQVTRRWKKYVKGQLGINVDLYALKHLNTTEMVDALDERAAADLNSQTTTAMVKKVYDVRNEGRKDKMIRSVSNQL